ncbi:hypothetical protein CC86DRAFT_381824 [Ophiobolus disseminans]|uniref:Uncharacterized protein n=1 Tax=Ophiobolus disseminans TaxID=1469910 RepID=A0A6A7A1Q2_9PLEO|nr:hypothetical protein CC86DRAFT_381824 [Ophiobolus disseminans]
MVGYGSLFLAKDLCRLSSNITSRGNGLVGTCIIGTGTCLGYERVEGILIVTATSPFLDRVERTAPEEAPDFQCDDRVGFRSAQRYCRPSHDPEQRDSPLHPIPRRYLRCLAQDDPWRSRNDALRYVGEYLDEALFGMIEVNEVLFNMQETLRRIDEALEREGEKVVGSGVEHQKRIESKCREDQVIKMPRAAAKRD